MRERLTKNDVEKIQAEIEHRKLVERTERKSYSLSSKNAQDS
mgnify:CR=1 FL=1